MAAVILGPYERSEQGSSVIVPASADKRSPLAQGVALRVAHHLGMLVATSSSRRRTTAFVLAEIANHNSLSPSRARRGSLILERYGPTVECGNQVFANCDGLTPNE